MAAPTHFVMEDLSSRTNRFRAAQQHSQHNFQNRHRLSSVSSENVQEMTHGIDSSKAFDIRLHSRRCRDASRFVVD
jgi:hypothetical protein